MNAKGIFSLRPRVRIDWNTGTRVMRSKRDKARTRQKLNAACNVWR